MSANFEKELNETVAYHEAGHAVMALHFGFRVTQIVLSPEIGYGSALGINRPNLQKCPSQSDAYQDIAFLLQAIRYIQVLLAGPIAEAEFCNKPYMKIIYSNQDFDNILEYLSSKLIRELEVRYSFLDLDIAIAETIKMIIQPGVWRKIETLAEGLMRDHSLNGDEVIALLSTSVVKQHQLRFTDQSLFEYCHNQFVT